MTSTVPPATLALRPATAADREFLLALFASTRPELAQVPLDSDQRDALVRMQFHAADLQYHQTFPAASFDVVEIDGRPAGRLYVHRAAGDIRIIDISLLPEHRRRGLGGALVRSVQDEAAASGRTVSLHVASGSPAAALYARLGFREIAEDGVYRLLEWRAR